MDEQYVEGRWFAVVKVGFIVEGRTDSIILKEAKNLKYLFNKNDIEVNEDFVINARSKSKLKENFVSHYKNLVKKGVDYVFILLDQDDKEEQKKNRKYKPPDCPIVTIREIQKFGDNKNYINKNQVYIVMTREMEAWFLADKKLKFTYEGHPEEINRPSDLVGNQLGTSSHVKIANKIKDKFSLERAAKNAPSAQRFLNKMEQLSGENKTSMSN